MSYCSTSKEREIIEAVLDQGSNNKASKATGVPRRTVDRTVHRVVDRAETLGYTAKKDPRILILDIETAPLQAYLWSLWQRYAGNMRTQSTYILSWAAKWLGETEVHRDALCFNPDYTAGTEDDRRMLEGIWRLMDEADFVVAHNGDKFDLKRLNTRFLLAGLEPPNPYKSIDTLKIVKRSFGFDSNKLEHLLQDILNEEKGDSGGFETWLGCLQGDQASWDTLLAYNVDDVVQLEKLYLKVRSWDRLHPSAATHGGTGSVPSCTVCSSEDVSKTNKTVSTGVSVFPVYRCNSCGTKMRDRHSILTDSQKQTLLVKAK